VPAEGEGRAIDAADQLWDTVKTIIVADCVMSLDNVIGVAAASHGSLLLLLFGLALSIPLIVWASRQIMTLMERFPVLVALGAGLIGYVAGDMMVADTAWHDAVAAAVPGAQLIAGALGAAVVVIVGLALGHRAAGAGRRIL
jgi:predicted tellurium resistance membrane protein TerC